MTQIIYTSLVTPVIQGITYFGPPGTTVHSALDDLDQNDHGDIYYTEAEVDALLAALGDTYYTETELDAGQLDGQYFTETEHINSSAGANDAGKPIKLDAGGHIDATMVNDADIDHGSIGGLGDDDHGAVYPLKTDGTLTRPTQTGGTETVTAVASAATMTLDMDLGHHHLMDTQDENTTLALSNAGSGKRATATLIQGAGGGFSIDVPGGWKPFVTPTPTTTAGEANVIEVWQTGAVVYYVLKAQA